MANTNSGAGVTGDIEAFLAYRAGRGDDGPALDVARADLVSFFDRRKAISTGRLHDDEIESILAGLAALATPPQTLARMRHTVRAFRSFHRSPARGELDRRAHQIVHDRHEALRSEAARARMQRASRWRPGLAADAEATGPQAPVLGALGAMTLLRLATRARLIALATTSALWFMLPGLGVRVAVVCFVGLVVNQAWLLTEATALGRGERARTLLGDLDLRSWALLSIAWGLALGLAQGSFTASRTAQGVALILAVFASFGFAFALFISHHGAGFWSSLSPRAWFTLARQLPRDRRWLAGAGLAFGLCVVGVASSGRLCDADSQTALGVRVAFGVASSWVLSWLGVLVGAVAGGRGCSV